jgi:putative ABC transport system permease protein
LFDYRLVSTLGWEQEDVEDILKHDDVRYAEGAISVDAMCVYADQKDTKSADGVNSEYVFKFHSLTKDMNKLQVVKGRLPEAEDECVIDSAMGDKPALGETIELLEANEEDTLDLFKNKKLKVVGWVDSSYYINFERGTTSIGTGTINGLYMYL